MNKTDSIVQYRLTVRRRDRSSKEGQVSVRSKGQIRARCRDVVSVMLYCTKRTVQRTKGEGGR